MDRFKTNQPEEDTPPPAPEPTVRLVYSKEEGVLLQPPRRLLLGDTQIGRAVEPSHLSLASDGQVSRLHAVLQVRAGQPPRLYDAGSSNGSFCNGQRVQEAALQDGDVLRIGNTLMCFRYEPTGLLDAPQPSLWGQSPQVRRLRHDIVLIGPSQATVLLLGESGVGKEVAARALHQASGLTGPFVAVNCSAIPESLAESQLFGHVAGAFTGAQAQPGYFRAAHGGTLFLDEVGELALTLQPKLLRALEERTVTPVGAVTSVPCKVRLLAATNRDLVGSIQAGRVRGDLYARLAELVLELPPLRTRREDILMSVQQALGQPAPRLSPRLAEALLLYAWPYNVRELLKVSTELRVRGAGAATLGLELIAGRLRLPLPPEEKEKEKEATPAASLPRPEASPAPPLPDKEQLTALLRAHGGRVAKVARALGRSRAQVYRFLAQYQLDPDSFRS